MKTFEEVQSHREKTKAEIEALERILHGIKERTAIPEAAKKMGLENFILILTTKKVTLEIIIDTLDWVME